MWLVRYPWLVEIAYEREGEFLGHGFKNKLIENEFVVKTNPTSSRKPLANSTIERIHKLLGNLVRTYNLHSTYVYDADPWMVILAGADFVFLCTYHRAKGKSPGQLVFGQDMILPINHVADCKYIRQRKQAQIEIDAILKNSTIIDYDYIVEYQVMIKIKTTFKYENSFKGPYEIVQIWTNRSVTLQTVAVITRVNILCIKTYKNNTEEANIFNKY